MFLTGCGNDNKSVIKDLNVDFQKFELPCSGDYCNDIKNNIIQIFDFEVGDYNYILVDSDGNVYLYQLDAFHKEGSLKKITDKTKVSYIDNIIEGYDNGKNIILIRSDNKYYSYEIDSDNSMIEKHITIDDANEYYSYKIYSDANTYHPSEVTGVSKSGQMIYYIDKGSEDQLNKKTLIGVDENNNEIKVKYYNVNVYLTENGELYISNSVSIPAFISSLRYNSSQNSLIVS